MDSIWTATASLPHFPPLRGEVKTDVLIVGGGMAGLLTAYLLREAGVNCAVAEAGSIAEGNTGCTTAKITAQHGLIYHKLLDRLGPERGKLYYQANHEALERYRTLCRDIPCDFSPQDNFIYAREDPAELEGELEALGRMGIPGELVREVPLPFPTLGAVRFPDQAQFHPLKFLAAIAEDLSVYENTPVRQLGKGFALTDRGKILAEKTVVATHFPILNKHGSYFLKLYQQRSYALALEGVPPVEGMYLDAAENGLSFRSFRGQMILGGGGHRTGKPGGGWSELEAFARTHYPDAQCTHRWAAQDCMSLDSMPYIGLYSARTPDLYVATGFNKWGMTGSMVAAKLLTDLITGRGSPYAALFSPSRSMRSAQLGRNAWEATRNLLSPSPRRCPHLGCALKWNPQEHTWECPCHGSRFDQEGTCLDNPATGNLKRPG